MQAVSTSPYHLSMARKFNTWYTIRDGNFSDPGVWMSNGSKKHSYPRPTDNVVINHKITFDIADKTTTINNLFVNDAFLWAPDLNQAHLRINGNVQCNGLFDLSGSTGGGGAYVFINGTDNFFVNFVTGTSLSNITIAYSSNFDFAIPNVNYYNLEIGGNYSKKTIYADLNVLGLLTIDSTTTFELNNFNVSVSDLAINGVLSKNSSTGSFTVTNASTANFAGTVNFTGSPTINWSGNMSGDLRGGVNFGTGTFNILTNSIWDFSSGGNIPKSIGSNLFLIAAGKTVTLTGIAAWLNTGTVDGVAGTSTLNVDTHYAFGNDNIVMATGIFNYNHSGTSTLWTDNSINITIPVVTFYNLIVNSGTTTLSGNTTVSNSLTVNSTLQLSSYNLSVSNVSSINSTVSGSGSGIIDFNIINMFGAISFTGSPLVNLSGDFTGDCRGGVNFGTGTVNIRQSIIWSTWTAGNVAATFAINFLIASGKTMQNVGLGSALGGLQTTGTINGEDATAIFDNRSICNYQNAQQPMQTGQLYCNEAANTFVYGLAGNQDITLPSDSTPGYQNLTLNGSGAKKLLGDVSVIGTYLLASPATLDSNGFSLTNP